MVGGLHACACACISSDVHILVEVEVEGCNSCDFAAHRRVRPSRLQRIHNMIFVF